MDHFIINWINNIAICIGYAVIIIFLMLMTFLITETIKEKYRNRKFRKNSISIPLHDYQIDNLGYTDTDMPAALIVADNLSDDELFKISLHLCKYYELYAVLFDIENKNPDDCIYTFIDRIKTNNLKIKRVIFNIPDGVNIRNERIKEQIDLNSFTYYKFSYYTLYEKRRRK